MRKLLFFAIAFVCLSANAQVAVQHLLADNLKDPIGLGNARPQLSWQLVSDKRNASETAYELRIFEGRSSGKLFWSSGSVTSTESTHVPYGGPELAANKKYFWQVRVTDNAGQKSPWSSIASWQMGLLHPADWKAQWIQPAYTNDSNTQVSPLMRKTFKVDKTIISATAYVTAHGLYEAEINGHRIGDAYLTPGWTSYNKRLQYQCYDVTALLQNGQNAVGVMLGSGWYRGHLAWADNKNIYGKDISLLFQLQVIYSDGSSQVVGSDQSWKSAAGPVKYSEIYDGEIIDARDFKAGWTTASYDDSQWGSVRTVNFSNENLIATINEPIKKHEVFKALKIITTPKGEHVIDFGQNLVGWVTMKVSGRMGDKITVSHAEVLDKAGNFYTDNLRAAKAQDVYTLAGGKEEIFEPHFTFHGFRYIRIDGYPGELKPENFTAVTLYSDMPVTGNFVSSNAMINQLQHNIQWGQRGNFLDVPTDCPQRDERLGWTGDAQAFSRTAAFNMGVDNFFAKWCKDMRADQQPNGSVPFVIPNVLGKDAGASAGWSDVSTIVPWNMYLAYGDITILDQQFECMKSWVNYMRDHAKNDLWNTGFHFGDWLFYRPEDDNDGRAAVTDKYLIAQCFFAHSTQLLINTASVLNKQEDVKTYTLQLQKIKDAFVKEYMTPSGRLVSGTQTAYVLALNFDMMPENLRAQAAKRLADNVADYGFHLTTGFLGTPYLCHVLTRFGYPDIAFKLLFQETYPSWLYPVKMGATTIWERWDGIKPDSSFETPSMNSYNHYAYGAIGDWMYREVAGIDTYEDGPGYKHVRVMPHVGGNFTSVGADLQTNYGLLSSHWNTSDKTTTFEIQIAPNTIAEIFLPGSNTSAISEGGKKLPDLPGITVVGIEDGYVHLRTGSGKYNFAVNR